LHSLNAEGVERNFNGSECLTLVLGKTQMRKKIAFNVWKRKKLFRPLQRGFSGTAKRESQVRPNKPSKFFSAKPWKVQEKLRTLQPQIEIKAKHLNAGVGRETKKL